ncbi:hypothetical protein C3747_6g636 [Trypanosoma cruzi]|uniref:Uncharacterized protein n=1 Tax=Trypanosoma cruzi TaxID=5693 RepID=A0A2V2XHY0_TRYCR|nr:hypothetical protein C3747_6g636 [Trypanosoma cruzi]
MRTMTIFTERRIICVSWHTNPRRFECRPHNSRPCGTVGFCAVTRRNYCPCVEADPFAVDFTQQLSSFCAAHPALAHSHVFQRCLACDLLCVVEAAASRFLLVPNRKHFALRWIFTCVVVDARDDAQRVCLLFGGHEGDFGVCRQHRESIRRRIEAKLTEVCPLHLSWQLRGTPSAQSGWMDAVQLGRPVFFSALRCPGKSIIRSVTASCILLLGIDCAEVARLM